MGDLFAGGFGLLFVGMIVLMIAMVVYGVVAARRRREALVALAARHGWHLTEREDAWCRRFSISPFGLGHDRQARNILSGVHDSRPFVAFEHIHHTTETSRDANGHTTTREVSHTHSVVALDLDTAFPRLEVAPEGLFSRMIGRLTNRDIELESEEFNRAFTVSCPDRRFASDVLHPRMMEFMLANRGGAFAFDSGSILNIQPGVTDLDTVTARLAFLDAVCDQIPEFVWAQARGQ